MAAFIGKYQKNEDFNMQYTFTAQMWANDSLFNGAFEGDDKTIVKALSIGKESVKVLVKCNGLKKKMEISISDCTFYSDKNEKLDLVKAIELSKTIL